MAAVSWNGVGGMALTAAHQDAAGPGRPACSILASSSAMTPRPTWPTSIHAGERCHRGSVHRGAALRGGLPSRACRCRRASVMCYRELARHAIVPMSPPTSWPSYLTIRASIPAPPPGHAPIAAGGQVNTRQPDQGCVGESTSALCPHRPLERRSLRRRCRAARGSLGLKDHCRQAAGRHKALAGLVGACAKLAAQRTLRLDFAHPAGAEAATNGCKAREP